MFDPENRIFSILNISKLPLSISKKLIRVYREFFSSKNFRVILFIDPQNIEKSLLEDNQDLFLELSFSNDAVEKTARDAKKFFKNIEGKVPII